MEVNSGMLDVPSEGRNTKVQYRPCILQLPWECNARRRWSSVVEVSSIEHVEHHHHLRIDPHAPLMRHKRRWLVHCPGQGRGSR